MSDSEIPETGLEPYIRGINNEIVHGEVLDNGDGDEFIVLVCLHGNNQYFLFEHPTLDFYEIRYRFNMVEELAGSLPTELITKITGIEPEEDDFPYRAASVDFLRKLMDDSEDERELVIQSPQDEDLPPPIQAAEEILASMDQDTLSRLSFNLFQELSYPQVATTILRDDDGRMIGFKIAHKVFPNDSGFCMTEYNKAVQSVISVGTFGVNTFNSAVIPELEIPLDSEEIN